MRLAAGVVAVVVDARTARKAAGRVEITMAMVIAKWVVLRMKVS